MAFVKRAHGRYETNRMPLSAPLRDDSADACDGLDGTHGGIRQREYPEAVWRVLIPFVRRWEFTLLHIIAVPGKCFAHDLCQLRITAHKFGLEVLKEA